MQRPYITDYENYRLFLRDWYTWMKEERPGFSYRAFSRWAGFKSPNQLQLIIQGKRNITATTITTFIKLLKFNKRERHYFELLVNMNQATKPEAKAQYLKEISSYFKKYKNNLRHNQYEYLMKWYYSVLRELVTTKGFRPERHKLAKRIGHGVTPRHIDEAMEKLIQLGMLAKDAKGTYKQSTAVITTGKETQSAAAYFYHDQMISLAHQALSTQMPDERNFSAITLACRKEDVGEIAQIVDDCRSQIIAYLEGRGKDVEDDEVYQLNVQLFRVTKHRGSS